MNQGKVKLHIEAFNNLVHTYIEFEVYAMVLYARSKRDGIEVLFL